MIQAFEDFKNKVRKFEVPNFTAIDVAWGFNVVEMVYNEIFLYDVMNTLFIYNTQEALSQIKDFEQSIGREFRKASLFGELVTFKDGQVHIKEDSFSGVNTVAVWSLNYITEDIFSKIIRPFFANPVFFIGDSEKWSVDKWCHSLLVKTSFYSSDITRVANYNLELFYLNKRVRNGTMTALEPIDHRAYVFKKVDYRDMNPDELLNYDIVISTLPNTLEISNSIRDMFSYKTIPNINEPMVTLEAHYVQLDDGTLFYLEAFSILKVLEVANPEGHPTVRFQFNTGHDIIEFSIKINTKHLNDYVNKYGELDIVYNTGLKVEYAYIIPPLYAIGKAWDNILILFTNPVHGSIKRPIYELTSYAKKKLTFFTDFWYKIY